MLKGIYTLLTKLDTSQGVTIDKRGEIPFLAGHYAYVGSALNGIEARVTRQLPAINYPFSFKSIYYPLAA